jgi:hypothetical protein
MAAECSGHTKLGRKTTSQDHHGVKNRKQRILVCGKICRHRKNVQTDIFSSNIDSGQQCHDSHFLRPRPSCSSQRLTYSSFDAGRDRCYFFPCLPLLLRARDISTPSFLPFRRRRGRLPPAQLPRHARSLRRFIPRRFHCSGNDVAYGNALIGIDEGKFFGWG